LSRYEKLLANWGSKEVDVNAIDFDDSMSLLCTAGTTDAEFNTLVEDLNLCLQEIFEAYFGLDDTQRADLVDLIEGKRRVLAYLVVFPEYAANQIHSSDDKLWVKTGAAAASIEGGRTDFRDLWVSLGALFCKARACDMDPEQIFVDVEAIAKPDQELFDSSKIGRGILSDFLKSEYLASLNCRCE
jgi:hypothetical protein